MLVKTYVSIAVAILGYIVMVIVGVNFAFLWALLIFALNFIPYVGPLISRSFLLLSPYYSSDDLAIFRIFLGIEAIHLFFVIMSNRKSWENH